MFVDAARPLFPDAEGVERARSATEAFLYRRYTVGRFRLNAGLPIPFDGFSGMEVDLLCGDSRVVVELDGAQHLGDPAAYHRDRHKDQLLQESGYVVLRFLAEDVSKIWTPYSMASSVRSRIAGSSAAHHAETVPDCMNDVRATLASPG